MLSRNPFRRPFPERSFGRSVLIGHARTALFVLLACWIFLFDLPRSLAYGLVTFLVAVTYSFSTDRLGVRRSGRRWTLARWTFDQGILLLLVSIACFLVYNATVGWSVLSLRVLLYIMVPTVLVGLLPIIFSGIALQVRAEQDHQRVASRIQLSKLGGAAGERSSGEETAHAAVPANVRYVYSRSGNSVTLHYGNKKTKREKQTLSELAQQPDYVALVRCHPRYLVNPDYIIAATADAQGVLLRLHRVKRSVPVSPDYFRAL